MLLLPESEAAGDVVYRNTVWDLSQLNVVVTVGLLLPLLLAGLRRVELTSGASEQNCDTRCLSRKCRNSSGDRGESRQLVAGTSQLLCLVCRAI